MKTYCIVWTVVMLALAAAMTMQSLGAAAVYAGLAALGGAAWYWPKMQRGFVWCVSVLILVGDVANVFLTRNFNLSILLGLVVAAIGFTLLWRTRARQQPQPAS